MEDFDKIFTSIYKEYGFNKSGGRKLMSEILGISTTQVDNYKSGKQGNPQLSQLRQLMKHCKDLSGHYLLTGEGSMKLPNDGINEMIEKAAKYDSFLEYIKEKGL